MSALGKRRYSLVENKAPLRLKGGARVFNPRGGGTLEAKRREDRAARRNHVHGIWEAHGVDVQQGHYYRENLRDIINPPIAVGVGAAATNQRIAHWDPEMDTDTNYPWEGNGVNPVSDLFNHGVLYVGADGQERQINNIFAAPGPLEISEYRRGEIEILQQVGTYYANHGGQGTIPGWGQEALWSFIGMDDTMNRGPAWSTFHYAISDLYAGGMISGSDIMVTVMMCAQDVITLTNGYANANGDTNYAEKSCLVFMEGKTDPDSDNRTELFLSVEGGTSLNAIANNPTDLFERLLGYFNSDAQFLFHRIYFCVLTQLAGNSLKDMPKWMKDMREGKLFKGVKGYTLIPDTNDNSCGLEAIVWSLGNIFNRIRKLCKKVEKQVPEIAIRFQHFRERVYAKGNKGKKEKELLEKTKKELAGFINWKKGDSLTHEQLCEMVSMYSEMYNLDLGLVIFDAVHPLTNYTINYDATKGVPSELICLVHWNYPAPSLLENANIPSGHYDCINATNVTTWLTSRNPKSYNRNTRFSFRSMCLLNTNQADDKGKYCDVCKHYQKKISTLEWDKNHGKPHPFKIFKECSQCSIGFKSEECFLNHSLSPHGLSISACDSQFNCPKCSRIHHRDYDCMTFYCQVCYDRFPIETRKKHVCYLGYASEKKRVRIPMVIYADMEGTRNGVQHGVHEAVCIAACWTCICDEHARLLYETSKDKKKCKNCISHNDNWEWFCDDCLKENEIELSNDCKDCKRKRYKYFVGYDCVDRFLDWVMIDHLGATVIFHNGGKYDLHILTPRILKSEKYYIVNDANRSTQIIFLIVGVHDGGEIKEGVGPKKAKNKYVYFKDSLNFIQSSLRNFNDMFHLGHIEKGIFPYDLLNVKGWEDWDGDCPGPEYFGITEKELKNLDNLANVRKNEIKEILSYIDKERKNGDKWNAMEKLKKYTLMDVEVLHDGCEIFRREFWDLVRHDPFQSVTLPAAVASAYRQPEFMKQSSIQIFKVPDREWQHKGLRGGRCEAFKMYWKKTKPSEKFIWIDVNSEYPWAQAYGYYPVGEMTLELNYQNSVRYDVASRTFFEKTGTYLEDVLQDPSGRSGCGLIECEYQSASDVFIPVIPARVKTENKDGKKGTYMKNVFQNRSGSCVLFLTVLAAAVQAKQVIILSIKRLQFWKNTSNKLFRSFICKLYSEKVKASGWNKILNKENPSEEEKRIFIEESAKRDIIINPDEVEDNPGKRNTSKMANNCGWGYLSKKLTTSQNHFFNNYDAEDIEDMVSLLKEVESENGRRMVGAPVGVGNYTKIRSTKKAENVTLKEMDKKVAYHVGGQVPAYGLQKLTSGLLYLDQSQPCYCDTDSIGYIYDSENKDHKVIETDPYLGGWTVEYGDYDIEEFVSCGCKSYFLKLVSLKDPSKIVYKGKFKGVPFSSASFSLTDKDEKLARLGLDEMKGIVINALERIKQDNEDREDLGLPQEESVDELTYQFHYTNFFKRSADYKIRAVKEHKTVRFTYDKRKIILPDDMKEGWPNRLKEINTEPLTDFNTNLTKKIVASWWAKKRIEREKECKRM